VVSTRDMKANTLGEFWL